MTTELGNSDASRRAERRGLSRRQMIKASAVAGAAAWTAPVIVDSLTSPAAAASFAECPGQGMFYAVLYAPDADGGLEDRDVPGDGYAIVDSPGTSGGSTSCTNQAPVAQCKAPSGYQRTFANNVRLTVETINRNISHNVTSRFNGPQEAVRVKLDPTSCCKIQKVKAYVHKYQAAGGNDCPPTNAANPGGYCQEAGAAPGGNAYLLKTVVSDKEWLVYPSTANLCGGVGVHWGSPNLDPQCVGYDSGAHFNGQPAGYMLIEFDCKQSYVQS